MRTNNFDFWGKKMIWDDYFSYLVNAIQRIKLSFNGTSKVLVKNRALKNIHSQQKAYIILNGPSLKKQNIQSLKSKLLFFVNRGYKHPDYEYLEPQYHVIIDNKLSTGQWPIQMLDEILEKNPKVTFILNSKWFSQKKFQPYKNKASIYWVNNQLFFTQFFNRSIDICKPMPDLAVFGTCLNAAIYMGCRPIYFTGFDGNGLAYELIEASSHFYGINEDNLKKNTQDYIRDLYMMSRNLRSLHYAASYCKRKNIDVINLTEGGLLDMFKREKFKT